MLAPISVLAGLVLVLGLNRCKVPLGASFLIGAVAMALMTGRGPLDTASLLGSLSIEPATWVFALLVSLVFLLTTVMRLTGSMETLVQAAGSLITNRRARLASLPALVGLLPMPGGALVSAPLVEQTRSDTALSAGDKNLINYWFRHIWEVSWPLYPPILLAATFVDGALVPLCLSQAALTLILAFLGYLFILRPVPPGADSTRQENPGVHRLGRAIAPFVVLIAGMPLLGMAIEHVAGSDLGGLGSQLGMSAALVVAIGAALALGRGGPRLFGRALREKATWTLLVLALGVKIFGGMVEVTGAAQGTATAFHDAGLPTLLGVALVPFFVGFVSGASIAFVTVGFPVVIAMIHEGSSPLPDLLPVMGFAYAMGFVGYMLSPVHMCLVLSSRYFKEDLGGAYRRMFLPLALFAMAAAALLAVAAVIGG